MQVHVHLTMPARGSQWFLSGIFFVCSCVNRASHLTQVALTNLSSLARRFFFFSGEPLCLFLRSWDYWQAPPLLGVGIGTGYQNSGPLSSEPSPQSPVVIIIFFLFFTFIYPVYMSVGVP